MSTRPPRVTPKNYLMPWLLAMLKGGNLHGYEINKHLRENFALSTDAGSVYRALRQLESEGYISSWWDSKVQGPTRRFYALTPAGDEALARWCDALSAFRRSLDEFFVLCEQTPDPHPTRS